MCEWSWGGEGESKRASQGLGKVALQGHDGFTFKVKLAQGQEQKDRGAFCIWVCPVSGRKGRAQAGRNCRLSLESERTGHGAAAVVSGGWGLASQWAQPVTRVRRQPERLCSQESRGWRVVEVKPRPWRK